MRSESAQRRSPARHHIQMYAGAHRASDVSSPYTSGPSNNLSPSQFHGMYVRSPIRRQYQRFMKAKSPYRKASSY